MSGTVKSVVIVLVALIVYDMVVKGLVSKIGLPGAPG